MLGKAIAITARSFKDKKDKGGKPYILHCLFVMNEVASEGEEVMTAAVMHDLVEDCPEWTIAKLRAEGFSERVLFLVDILTHYSKDTYDIYIKHIAVNEVAAKIKRADLRHNSDITRMKGLRKKDFDRLEKYHRAYMYLNND